MRVSLLRSWLAWFAPLFALWLLYVGYFDRDVLVAGLAAAAVAATLATAMHATGLLDHRIDLLVVLRELRTLAKVYPDFARLLVATARGGRTPACRFRWVDFPYPSDDERTAAANRAVVTTTSSLAPAAYVVHVDGERCRMLVHELDP
jgi:hypothetical protein